MHGLRGFFLRVRQSRADRLFGVAGERFAVVSGKGGKELHAGGERSGRKEVFEGIPEGHCADERGRGGWGTVCAVVTERDRLHGCVGVHGATQ